MLSKSSSQPGGASIRASTRPSASLSARSRLSASRGRIPSRITIRSTTASMLCALAFASFGGVSVTSIISPSTRARISPARRMAWKTSRCCPLRSRTSGARSWTFRPAGQRHQLVGHLLRSLAADRRIASRAMRRAGPGEEQAQVVVDLGDGPERAPRVGRPGLLVDRDRRRQALDRVDVGPLELVEELPGEAGEAFEIPALALRIDRVEGQRALPRPADSRQHDQPVARQVDVDVPQVMHPRART